MLLINKKGAFMLFAFKNLNLKYFPLFLKYFPFHLT